MSFEANEIINFVPVQNAGGALTVTSANSAENNSTVYKVTGAVNISIDNTVPDGFQMTIIQQDDNQATIVAGTGLTLRNFNGDTGTAGQYAVVYVERNGSNLILWGDTGVAPSAFNAYMFLEPQDGTSQTDLGTYMSGIVGVTWGGFGVSAGPPSGDYQLNWESYAKYSGFVTAGAGNFITPTADMKGNIRQLAGFGVDSFGIPQRQYNVGTIEVLPTTNVNPAVQYIFSVWIPIAGVNNAISASQFTVGNRGVGSTNLNTPALVNASASLLTSAEQVVITTGAAIPAGTYRVLYLDNTQNAVISSTPWYFRQDNIQV
jgi:hypothetical protein